MTTKWRPLFFHFVIVYHWLIASIFSCAHNKCFVAFWQEFVVGWLVRWTLNAWTGHSSTTGQDRVKGRFSVFPVNTCADSSVSFSPSCAKHILRSLRALNTPCSPFCNKSENGRWHGNTQMTQRMIKIMIVSTLMEGGGVGWRRRRKRSRISRIRWEGLMYY